MTDVQILIYPGFDELDAIGPYEIFRSAGLNARLVTVGDETTEIVAGHGLRVGVDGPLQDSTGILVVPGGGWASGTGGARVALAEGALAAAVARLHAGGATIASVCTGAVFLAAAGLLEGRPAITHRAAIDFIREHGADVREEARVVDDGDIGSAGGVTSGLDLAFHLVERFVDAETAERGAIRAEHDRRGPTLITATAA